MEKTQNVFERMKDAPKLSDILKISFPDAKKPIAFLYVQRLVEEHTRHALHEAVIASAAQATEKSQRQAFGIRFGEIWLQHLRDQLVNWEAANGAEIPEFSKTAKDEFFRRLTSEEALALTEGYKLALDEEIARAKNPFTSDVGSVNGSPAA